MFDLNKISMNLTPQVFRKYGILETQVRFILGDLFNKNLMRFSDVVMINKQTDVFQFQFVKLINLFILKPTIVV